MPNEAAKPVADRPAIPYGMLPEKEGTGLIPWERFEQRMRSALVYWVCTVDTQGRPHAIPVWGLWFEGALYFSNGETTRTGRALAAHPQASVHLESGEDVAMIEGAIDIVNDAAIVEQLNARYMPKYVWPEAAAWYYVLRATRAFAWLAPSMGTGNHSVYAGSATRWRFR